MCSGKNSSPGSLLSSLVVAVHNRPFRQQHPPSPSITLTIIGRPYRPLIVWWSVKFQGNVMTAFLEQHTSIYGQCSSEIDVGKTTHKKMTPWADQTPDEQDDEDCYLNWQGEITRLLERPRPCAQHLHTEVYWKSHTHTKHTSAYRYTADNTAATVSTESANGNCLVRHHESPTVKEEMGRKEKYNAPG